MLSTLLNRPCTIVRRSDTGTLDEYGNAIVGESLVDTVCELQMQQLVGAEPEGQGEFSDTRWRLFLPAGTGLDTSDVVEIGGEAYEVVGDPWNVRNPRTRLESHIEASLRRTAGSEEVS